MVDVDDDRPLGVERGGYPGNSQMLTGFSQT
jgi:hypothetical protein